MTMERKSLAGTPGSVREFILRKTPLAESCGAAGASAIVTLEKPLHMEKPTSLARVRGV